MDLTILAPLLDQLKAAGDVGYVIASAIPIVLYFLYQRYYAATPGTTPLKDSAPMLDLILKALGIVPKNGVATADDLPHDVHLKLQAELDKVAADKSATMLKQQTDFANLKLVETPPVVAPVAK